MKRLPLVLVTASIIFALLFLLARRPGQTGPQRGSSATARETAGAPAAEPAAAPQPGAAATGSEEPFPSLLGEARVGRPGPDTRPIADRYAQAPVIWSVERAGGLNNEFVQRIRLVRTEMKYPLIRLEETWRRVATPDGPKELLLQQLAMVGDHLMLQPVAGMDPDHFASQVTRAGGHIRTRLRASGTYLVEIPATTPEALPSALAALRSAGIAAAAEPDYLVYASKTPNDPRFSERWDLQNTGQNSGTPGADIGAIEAWEVCTGSREIRVGIIDSGIDYTHPDLAANIWTNPGEIPHNGIDDDHNGYIDDMHGWDFVDNDNDPMDDQNHGTLCAGLVGAVGNNGGGVVGVNWQVSLVGLKAMNIHGYGSTSDIVEAIYYANGIGVDISSASNTALCNEFSLFLNEALKAAAAHDQLFVTAAGNATVDLDDGFTGQRFATTNVIVVAATDRYDLLADFSNFGATTVDLAAPGHDIASTQPGIGYQPFSGTSAATPVVAGAAALLKAAYPQLSSTEIKGLLLSSVDPLPALTGKCRTGGRLNLGRAVSTAAHLIIPFTTLDASGPCGGPFANPSITYTVRNLGPAPIAFTAAATEPWIAVSAVSDPVSAHGSVGITVSLNNLAATLPVGRHTGTVVFNEPSSGFVITREVRLEVVPPAVYSFRLDSDPGWSRTGQWAFGQPKFQYWYGGADPTAGHTGANVFGIALDNYYTPGAAGPDYLTAGPFNLTGYGQTRLRFQRWLNLEGFGVASATIDISTNGTEWTRLWQNSGAIRDRNWVPQEIDLSAYADNQATVYLRWGHQTFAGANDSYSGWNIDDIEVLGEAARRITFAPFTPVSETTGSLATTIQITPAPTNPLTIRLNSNLPTVASLPATVVVPTGSTSVPLTITIHDDALLNGTRDVSFELQATNYVGVTSTLAVEDNESTILTVTVPATVVEGDLAIKGTVSCSTAPVAPVVVKLAATPNCRAVLPPSVLLPAGATSIEFPVILPENRIVDGTSSVSVTASVQGWISGSATIEITDNEYMGMGVSLHSQSSEDDGTCSGSVAVFCALPSDLVVSLTSSDTSEMSVPETVVIPAGSSQVEFLIRIVNDGIVDGPQTVTITAKAPGFADALATTVVTDATQCHYTFDPIVSPQAVGVAFPVRITVRSPDGAIVTDHYGQAPITAVGGGTFLPRTVTSPYFFNNGVWEGSVTIYACGPSVVLHTSCGNTSGVSNAFQVVGAAPIIDPEPAWSASSENRIQWSAIPMATAYQSQCATNASFTAPISSNWSAEQQHWFTGLSDGVTYFYRVRAAFLDTPEQAPGPWSATVSSTQDAVAPLLVVTSPRLATTAGYTLAGTATDLSGVAALTVGGTAATTSDAFAHWSRAVTLQPGLNTFAVSATDRATPAQTAEQSVTILRLPSLGDSDTDGLSDLLEFALGLDPLIPNKTGAPTIAIQTNAANGLSYLTFTYRRRLARTGLGYHIESSNDLATWTEILAPEEIAAAANADGITETVTVRLLPALDSAATRRFVRLKVTVP